MNDHKRLSGLGCGRIGIDVLTERCTFNDSPIEALGIARELGAWFRDDLATHHIPIHSISAASLVVEFRTEPLTGRRKAPEIWARTDPQTTYTSCHIHCESCISTDEHSYTLHLDDYEEWPDSWWTSHDKGTSAA